MVEQVVPHTIISQDTSSKHMHLPNQANGKYNIRSMSTSSHGSLQGTFITLNNVVMLVMVVETYAFEKQVTRLTKSIEELAKHNQEQDAKIKVLFYKLRLMVRSTNYTTHACQDASQICSKKDITKSIQICSNEFVPTNQLKDPDLRDNKKNIIWWMPSFSHICKTVCIHRIE